MKILPISQNSYKNVSFLQKQHYEDRKNITPEKLMKIWAAGALTSLAVAYGGGQIILKDFERNVNEILDNYEKELILLQHRTDSIYKEFKDFEDIEEREFDVEF